MNFLIATSDNAFLKDSSAIIEKELPQITQIEDALNQADILKKITQKSFDYILIDHDSCSIASQTFAKLKQLEDTKIKISSQNYADIPVEFFNQKSIQILNILYSSSTQNLNRFILNNKDYFWGEDIKQLSLYKGEILCNEGSIGDAIYLVKEGFLQREFADGSILDGSIGAGKMVGELAYFNREPRKWKVVAVENCTLVRIAYQKVDEQLKNQPGWIKVMFTTLAERSLKYAKSS